MSVARKNLVLAAAATLVAAAVHAASIVPPENLGELARISDAVVLGQAGAPRVSERGIQAFTLTTFRVLGVVSGELERGDRITVEAPGGELDAYLWFVPGSPRFEPGQVYLLFLNQKPTGEWLPRMMAYGLLRRVHGRDGSSLLAPLPEQTGIQPFPRPDGILPEPVETYRETALLPHLRAVAIGRDAWDSRKVLARSDQIPFEAQAQTIPAGCKFMTQGNSFRWQAFDLGQSATMQADATGDSSLSGGGFAQVQGALSDWMGVPSTSMRLVYGGAGAYTMPCTGGQDYPSNDIVVFNDPCSDIPDLSGCSGTLGYGGVGASGSHSFDGMTWWTINHWYMVVNNGAGCLGPTNYQRMLAHELGHGLGFDHVSDPSALMYYMCCNTINSTDTTCAQYLYPTAGPTPTPSPTSTPTPTPTPPTSPPPAPTGVSASDGTWSDRVRILWNTSAGATSYHVYRNTTNDSNTATDLGYVTGTGADDMSAVAGTTYYYWVKAFNALGGSPFSSPDTGFRATGAAPTPTPTPVPSGPPVPTGVSASDGTYTDRVRITWNASAGATGYWIYRNTTASPPATEIAWVGSPGYDDSTAVPGQTYWYWVRAGNASGWSTYSASDTGFRATGTLPTPTPTSTPPPGGLAASFAFLPTTPTQGQQIQFTDTSTGASAWDWSFGDGTRSSARNPAHTYAVRGTYTVTLRVSNGVGSSQTTKTITVGARARRNFSGR